MGLDPRIGSSCHRPRGGDGGTRWDVENDERGEDDDEEGDDRDGSPGRAHWAIWGWMGSKV